MVWEEDVLRSVAERFNEGQVDPFLELFAEDVVINAEPQVADRPVYHGLAGVREWFEETMTRWSATRVNIASVEVHGDRALLEFDLIGGGGAWRLFAVLWFDGRLIARGDFFADRRDALERLGN